MKTVSLQTHRDPRIAGWIKALDGSDPSDPQARAIYAAAMNAGLSDALCAALEAEASLARREADALQAELDTWESLMAQVDPVMSADPSMTFGEALAALKGGI